MNLAYNPSSDLSPMHFTGKQRDYESGLDNFGARYFGGGNNIGRFMTPDWASKPTAVPYATFGNPQSLNLYSYVGNNPLSHIDGDGHVGVCQGGVQQCANDLNKLAPGTTVAADGTVKKASLAHRILNHLDGNGAGTALVSAIVNTSTVVHINPVPGSGNGLTTGDKNNVTVDYGLAATEFTRTGPGNSAIEETSTPSYVVLGHELIHATHFANGTVNNDLVVHSFSDPSGSYSERGRTEEFRTIGFRGFTRPGDITENQLKQQFGLNDRAAFSDDWKPQQ
jgi:RHS repeat-associated protein